LDAAKVRRKNRDAAINWSYKQRASYLPRVELECLEVLEKFFTHFELGCWLTWYLL
jgi:NTP pyrophosphatase (non-canonical NTP hydrolase)